MSNFQRNVTFVLVDIGERKYKRKVFFSCGKNIVGSKADTLVKDDDDWNASRFSRSALHTHNELAEYQLDSEVRHLPNRTEHHQDGNTYGSSGIEYLKRGLIFRF